MQYNSLNHSAPTVSFKEAVINGLAPDKGLYYPASLKPLEKDFFDHIEYFSEHEIAFQVIRQFIGTEIPEKELKRILQETLNFEFPIKKITPDISVLELFHGQTMAFKDVGARFMARCLGYFNKLDKTSKVTILVATSGDTGGAVASGFLNVPGVDVVILYPSGKVSEVQEKQLTTLGNNITALEVEGTFDDCQDMVKRAFLDEELNKILNLTSANSINVARWLPQMFYFFFAYRKLKNKHRKLLFSVPSGNFGNICAGLLAKQLGLPVHKFIAATNINDVVPKYLKTGKYDIKASVQTISNAMDVGNPSNFVRIATLYDNNLDALKNDLVGFSYSDDDTKQAMHLLYQNYQYIADPHGAVGYLALEEYLKQESNVNGIFLETAHPIKFLDVIDPKLSEILSTPTQIAAVMDGIKKSIAVKSYENFKEVLLQS